MATLAELRRSIDQLLQHPLGPTRFRISRNLKEKAYEAYVFGLCLRAARELGATPVLLGIQAAPTPFIFRGAPGKIHSTHRNYGYARFSLNGIELEIHAGVEFVGTSRMMHEIDVSIMRSEDAQNCRQHPSDPKCASLIGAWECKFYDKSLNKNLARAFVGLVSDLGTNIRINGFCSNQTHDQIRDYLSPRKRPHPHLRLTPLNSASENEFVTRLSSELRKMARI
jgi:hypothetical protein